MNGLELPYGIKPTNPILIDTWAGPYISVLQANQSIPLAVRQQTRFVNIIDFADGNKGKIYWYRDGVADENLVPFIGTYVTYIGSGIIITQTKVDEEITVTFEADPESYMSFDTYADMQAYLLSDKKYPGQIATCKNRDRMIFTLSSDMSEWFSSNFEFFTIGNYRSSNVLQKITQSASVFSYAHSSCQQNNKFYIGTRTFPGQLICFTNPDNLASYQSVITTGRNKLESMVYDSTKNKLYCTSWNNDAKLCILEINPNDISDYSIVYNSTDVNAGPSPAIVTDGTYLYGGTHTTPVTIFKIRMSDWVLVSTNVIQDIMNVHAAKLKVYPDKTEMYLTNNYFDPLIAQFVKVNCETLAFERIYIPEMLSVTDDFALVDVDDNGGIVYAGSEIDNKLVAINTNLMTYQVYDSVRTYGVFKTSEYLYVLGVDNCIARHNLNDLNVKIIDVTGSDIPNEFFESVDGKTFYTDWQSSGKLVQFKMFGQETSPVVFNVYDKDFLNFEAGKNILIELFDKKIKISSPNTLTSINDVLIRGEYFYQSQVLGVDSVGDWRVYSNATGYYIEYCTNSYPSKGGGNWVLKDSVLVDGTHKTHDFFDPNNHLTTGGSSKTEIIDTDNLIITDSQDSSKLKKFTWANLKTKIKSFFENNDNELVYGKYYYRSQAIGQDTPGDWRTYSDTTNFYYQYCTLGNATKGAGTWITKHIVQSVLDTNVKLTGTHAGELGQESITNDYIYRCVQSGNASTAIWKKFPLTESINI